MKTLISSAMMATMLASAFACSTTTDDSAGTSDAATPVREAGTAADSGADARDAAADGFDASRPRCSTEGFCREDLDPSDDVLGVWGDGTGVVWAVATGNMGKIYRWDGAAWSLNASFGDRFPTGIWGSGPTDIYVAAVHAKVDAVTGVFSQPGEVLHGTGPNASAITWTSLQISRDAVLNAQTGAVWGTGPSDVWVAGTEEPVGISRGFVAHLTRKTDGSLTNTIDYLAPVPVAPRGPRTLSAVFGNGPDDVWVGGADTALTDDGSVIPAGGVVLRRTVTGATVKWIQDTGPNAALGSALLAVRAGTGLAPGKVAVSIERTNDVCEGVLFSGAPSWARIAVAPPTCHEPVALWGTTNDLWAVGLGGLVREWDGATWRLARTVVDKAPIAATLRAIWGSAPDDFWIVGDHGTVLHKTKAGTP